MPRTDERTALCALNKALGYVPAAGHALLQHFGAAAPVFDQPDAVLREALGPYRDFADQLDGQLLEWAAGELDRIQSGGFRMIAYGEEDYPSLLAECEDPPLALYFNASSPPAAVFEMRPCIAVVGTRDLSPYGRDWCRRLVLAMGEASVPPCIVSGLAFGADGIAHRTALECGLTTVGVMATGIEKVYPWVYPWQHTELAGEMVRTPGCAVVTDYPTGSAPVALNFIRRNRIIAGLSRATVVIESKTRGGSLITAKYACDYNRDVYGAAASSPRSTPATTTGTCTPFPAGPTTSAPPAAIPSSGSGWRTSSRIRRTWWNGSGSERRPGGGKRAWRPSWGGNTERTAR